MGNPLRNHQGQFSKFKMTPTPAWEWNSFWSRVDKTTTCWLWIGSDDGEGYGRFRGRGAHRFAYERCVGPIPRGKQLDHLCRITNCVNPLHLEPVTNKENVLRGISMCAENARKDFCKNGHPLSGENLKINTGTRPGRRSCRTCLTLAKRRWRIRHGNDSH